MKNCRVLKIEDREKSVRNRWILTHILAAVYEARHNGR